MARPAGGSVNLSEACRKEIGRTWKELQPEFALRCQEHRRTMPFVGCWINLIPSSLGWMLGQETSY